MRFRQLMFHCPRQLYTMIRLGEKLTCTKTLGFLK